MQELSLNGIDLAYIERGQGQPVLFVHGGIGDYRDWERQVEAFGSRYRAIAVSCRGHWPNRKPEPGEHIPLDTFVEDLATFIRVLEAAPVHLVGHSSPGGFGSLVLARRYPELLRSLVLLEPPALTLLGVNIPPAPPQLLRLLVRSPRAGSGLIKFGAKGIGPAMKAFDRGDDEAGLRIFIAANTSERTLASLPADKFQRYVDNVGSLKAQIKAGFPEFGEADARSIQVPALLVAGTGTPAHLLAVTDRLEALLPDVRRLDIAGATHNMFDSHPAEFNAGVLEFIGGQND